jgi:hypothetical protein
VARGQVGDVLVAEEVAGELGGVEAVGVDDRGVAVEQLREVVVGLVGQGAELAVGDDVGLGHDAQPAGATEVVGVAVGDQHGVDPFGGGAELGHPMLQRGEAGRIRHARVDDGEPVGVLQQVAVDVSEPRQADGQLGPVHARSDLRDLVVGRQLLLLVDRRRHPVQRT